MARILIVDDDPAMREHLALLVRARGHVEMLAPDAVEAIKQLLHDPVDLVISDIRMPYLDGVEFLRAVMSDGRTCHIPVVFVTALNDEATWLEAMRAGAAGYLTKPVRSEELAREVDRALSGKARKLGPAS
jgi:CheY-like chemotaxis protein